MSRYEIVPCRLSHIRSLAATLRPDDRREIEGAGLVPRHLLTMLYRRSLDAKCALVDGEVAACWGDQGGLLDDDGLMWLFTAPPVERLPLAFYREARREIAERLRVRRRLIADVADSYAKATRFFRMLGFSLDEPREARSGVVYRRMMIGA